MIRIDVLPDDILIEIFYFYLNLDPKWDQTQRRTWQLLVHVCRRWRSLVFESSRFLDLRLYCTHKTPARDKLDIWPALPLDVEGHMTYSSSSGTDNIIGALGQSNRVRRVFLLDLMGWQLEEVLAPMQVSFPEMTDLQLSSIDKIPPVIPDSYLDGSAPRLQYFELSGISFPGVPKLVLSATHLRYLYLRGIPHSGYISPEAMVALLSTLSNLDILYLIFQSPQSRPDWESRRLPPPKRSILPALYQFRFKGVTEYLEELVTRIDTPRLKDCHITFFNQIDFDCSRLAQFINRTPEIRPLDIANVLSLDGYILVGFPTDPRSYLITLWIEILCKESDWQLSSMEQVCNSCFPTAPTVEYLYVENGYSDRVWKNDGIENTLWLELFRPFTAVKNLYLSKEFAPGIADAMQELVGSSITGVLPSLQNISVNRLEPSGPFRESIGQFVAARQLSGRPIAISVWK